MVCSLHLVLDWYALNKLKWWVTYTGKSYTHFLGREHSKKKKIGLKCEKRGLAGSQETRPLIFLALLKYGNIWNYYNSKNTSNSAYKLNNKSGADLKDIFYACKIYQMHTNIFSLPQKEASCYPTVQRYDSWVGQGRRRGGRGGGGEPRFVSEAT